MIHIQIQPIITFEFSGAKIPLRITKHKVINEEAIYAMFSALIQYTEVGYTLYSLQWRYIGQDDWYELFITNPPDEKIKEII